MRTTAAWQLFEAAQDFLLIGVHALADGIVHFEALFQAEQVILPPMAAQLSRHLRFAFAASSMA